MESGNKICESYVKVKQACESQTDLTENFKKKENKLFDTKDVNQKLLAVLLFCAIGLKVQISFLKKTIKPQQLFGAAKFSPDFEKLHFGKLCAPEQHIRANIYNI